MAIEIEMSLTDFSNLAHEVKLWAGQGWEEKHPGRFEPVPVDDTVKSGFKRAYWVGDCWACVVLARAFLEDRGDAYQVLRDKHSHDGEWVVLTDR